MTEIITFNPNHYIDQTAMGTPLTVITTGSASWSANDVISFNVQKPGKGISPILYFKYVKSKFKLLERIKLDRRLGFVEKAFEEALEYGQDALGEKILKELTVLMRESTLYGKGIIKYIERTDALKYKRALCKGHISDTMFKNYTRAIPKSVLKNKKAVEDVFDDFVIYHYWSEEQKDVEKMTPNEKAAMKDPILFGIIKETDRLYFVDDWIDEKCDLTFSKMVDAIGKECVGSLTSKVKGFGGV